MSEEDERNEEEGEGEEVEGRRGGVLIVQAVKVLHW